MTQYAYLSRPWRIVEIRVLNGPRDQLRVWGYARMHARVPQFRMFDKVMT